MERLWGGGSMITPSFGLTATERVLPKLALDFTTASLDSRVTFTRSTSASNPATYINSSGYVTLATDNQPRFDYDPVTLACRGLLIEGAGTNILSGSQDLANATYWTPTSCSIAATALPSPDNTDVWFKLVMNNGVNNGNLLRTTGMTASVDYTFSVFCKKAEWSWVELLLRGEDGADRSVWFDLDNGAVGNQSAGATGRIAPGPNGSYRCSITINAGAGTSANRWRIFPTNVNNGGTLGDGTSGILVWGTQGEQASFASSYIPTTTTALTRNADVATMTGTNFSDWFNASEGTFVASATTPNNVSVFRPFFYVSDNTTSNVIGVGQTTGGVQSLAVLTGGALQASLASTTITGTTSAMSGTYKANSFKMSVNGNSVVSDASGTVPTLTQMQIGQDKSSRWLCGAIESIYYFPLQLTNGELQAFSK